MDGYDVELRNATKRFGDLVAVDAVNLAVKTGEFVSIIGPSGCGKTTTMRMIAGSRSTRWWRGDHPRPADAGGSALRAKRRARLPELRPLPAPRRLGQRRVRAAHARRRQDSATRASQARAAHGRAGRIRAPARWPALRRAATAGGVGARTRRRAGADPPRRTARLARRPPPHRHAERAQITPAAAGDHLHPRLAQPGRSVGHGRSHRSDERGTVRAGRCPGRHLRHAAHALRGSSSSARTISSTVR